MTGPSEGPGRGADGESPRAPGPPAGSAWTWGRGNGSTGGREARGAALSAEEPGLGEAVVLGGIQAEVSGVGRSAAPWPARRGASRGQRVGELGLHIPLDGHMKRALTRLADN